MQFKASKIRLARLGAILILVFSVGMAGAGKKIDKAAVKVRTKHNKTKIAELCEHMKHDSFLSAINEAQTDRIDLSFNGGEQKIPLMIKGKKDVYIKREVGERSIEIFTVMGPAWPRSIAAKKLALVELMLDDHSLDQLVELAKAAKKN